MILFDKIVLEKVISGGQTGADQGGLEAARFLGYKTGGYAPRNFRTWAGNNYQLRDTFGLVETEQANYAYRTMLNVKESDATIRLATNFESPGELKTLQAIQKYKKPWIDVDLNLVVDIDGNEQYIIERAEDVIKFLLEHQVRILNVAGNADRTHQDGFGAHYFRTLLFLTWVFHRIKNENL